MTAPTWRRAPRQWPPSESPRIRRARRRVILGVRMRGFNRIDRSSGLALAAVAALTLAGIVAVVLARSSEVAADSATPRGIVATYVRAIQAGDADTAWSLLNQNGTA